MQDIHDIRPPVMVGVDPAQVRITLIVLAVLAALLLLWLGIRYFLKKRKKSGVPERVALVLPYDQAIRDLAALETRAGLDAKAYYFELGRIVKAYMAEVFQVHCLEMTTQELARAVRDLPLSRDLKQEITRFQSLCDPFRYAPVSPSESQVRSDLSRARVIIDAMEKEAGQTGEGH